MKALLLVLLGSIFLLLSCQHTNRSQAVDQDDVEEIVNDTIPKSTAVFWIDKKKSNLTQKTDFPTSATHVKVKVDITSAGKVKILSYVKPQEQNVMTYLQDRLKTFQVTKVMLDSGFVKPGVQYVQLKYIRERMEKYR